MFSKAHQVARALRAGSLWVNCYQAMDPAVPFGGYKMSVSSACRGVWIKTA
jgi:aldehyde dehydrogenase (NAD+)